MVKTRMNPEHRFLFNNNHWPTADLQRTTTTITDGIPSYDSVETLKIKANSNPPLLTGIHSVY